MNSKFEIIHAVSQEKLIDNPQWNMPYVPAIRVLSGKPVYISGVNAAPIYHSHPHEPEEFQELDFSPENQAILRAGTILSFEGLTSLSLGSSCCDLNLQWIVDAPDQFTDKYTLIADETPSESYTPYHQATRPCFAA